MIPKRMGGASSVGGSRRLATWYDWLGSTALVVVWLLPVLWTGGTGRNAPFASAWMQQQYRVACLFLESLRTWHTYHVQVQYEGLDAWIELDMRGIFDMTVFGFRSRLHAILDETYQESKGSLRMDAIAEFIRTRYQERHPLEPKLAGLRFVYVERTIKELGRETGAFETGTLADWAFREWLVFGEKRWDGKEPDHPLWGAKVKPARKGRYLKPAMPAPRPLDIRMDVPDPAGDAERKASGLRPQPNCGLRIADCGSLRIGRAKIAVWRPEGGE
jgi:hypothetical protein